MPLPAFLLPLLGGAAAGAGLGALTSKDGFSDDGWWKGALMGGLTGGLGGHFGLLGGGSTPLTGKLAGMGGAKSMTGSQLGANLGTGPAHVSSYVNNPAAAKFINPKFVDMPTGMDYSGMWNNVNEAGQYIGTNPDLGGQGGGMFGSMMPSSDTMMKGLLGSQILKSVAPQSKPIQSGSISRGQRAAPFQPRQPIMMGGGRPQRRSFRR